MRYLALFGLNLHLIVSYGIQKKKKNYGRDPFQTKKLSDETDVNISVSHFSFAVRTTLCFRSSLSILCNLSQCLYCV